MNTRNAKGEEKRGFPPLEVGYGVLYRWQAAVMSAVERTLGCTGRKSERFSPPRLLTGFTLIETMVAVSILALAVAGPLLTASRAIVAAQTANAQVTASYLAQEGIEYVRQVRDNAYLAAYAAGAPQVSVTAWQDFLSGPMASCRSASNPNTRCTVDPLQSPNVSSCTAGSCPPLYSTGAVYTQQSGNTGTPFTRTIELRNVAASPVDVNGNHAEIQVLSTVSWVLRGTAYSVVVSDNLTEWQ